MNQLIPRCAIRQADRWRFESSRAHHAGRASCLAIDGRAAGTRRGRRPFQRRRPNHRSANMYIGLGGLILLIIVLVILF
ncbi:MAG: hypothetical protein ABIP91_02345 [Sphingomicrobium sp.]